MSGWLLYGANGYTGELIAEEAARRGKKPILAGRRADAIQPMADKLGLEARVFPLDDAAAIAKQLEDVDAILLAAGPFSATSAPVVEACLRTGTHYADITGEIPVFEACHARDAQAKAAGCVIMPGVGFDVVPSDCLAASLKAALPDAERLELAFAGGGFSKGTAKTMVEGIAKGGAVREDGTLRPVPLAWKSMDVPFRDKTRRAVSIPWGDVSTAWFSTGIPNIVVYMAAPPRLAFGMKMMRPLAPVIALKPIQDFLKRRIDKSVAGPDEEERTSARTHLWGRVRNREGAVKEGTLETPESYQLTVLTALAAIERIADGKVPPGARTPAMAFGAGFITEIPGCDLEIH